MATTFTQAKATLDEIAARSETNRKRILQIMALAAQTAADLDAMQTAYTGFAADLDSEAAANPTDEAWQTAKAEKDQMAADFMALKATADALNTAVGN